MCVYVRMYVCMYVLGVKKHCCNVLIVNNCVRTCTDDIHIVVMHS